MVKHYTLYFTKQAIKDSKNVKRSGLQKKVGLILKSLEQGPYSKVYRYEKLVGDLNGLCSVRINLQHRIVYQIIEDKKAIKIIRMWTHYE